MKDDYINAYAIKINFNPRKHNQKHKKKIECKRNIIIWVLLQ